MYNDNRDMVYIEKRATNKVGIFIVVLLSIIGFSVGGYMLYKNFDNIDFSLPWVKNNEDNKNKDKEEKKDKDIVKEEIKTVNGLVVPKYTDLSHKVHNPDEFKLKIDNVQADKSGYSFEVMLVNNRYLDNDEYKLDKIEGNVEIYRVLLDEFEVSIEPFNLSVDLNKLSDSKKVKISKAELDALEIKEMTSLTLLARVVYTENPTDAEPDIIKINQSYTFNFDSNGFGKYVADFTRLYSIGYIEINYYKLEEDAKNNYLYFYIVNKQNDVGKCENIDCFSFIMNIKNLYINDELYLLNDFKHKTYHDSKSIFYIAIPKSKYRKIDSFKVSFILSRINSNGDREIYQTREQLMDLNESKNKEK